MRPGGRGPLRPGGLRAGLLREGLLPQVPLPQGALLPPADLPAEVSRFKKHVEAADALLFVTPEHSRSIPAVLKNAIDWGMRPWGKTSWPNKPAAVTGTSPGAIGTAIVQQHLKAVLGAQGLHLMGGEAYVTFKPDLVDADNNIADESVRTFLKAFVDNFVTFAGRFAAPAAPRAAA